MKESDLNLDQALSEGVDIGRLPVHIAIIMDGNGRWAKKHRFQRIRGHRRGMKTVREVVTVAKETGIKVLTLYAFSEENWKRPAHEVRALMGLLKQYLIEERNLLRDKDIRLIATGNISKLPKDARKELDRTMELTKNNGSMILNLALSYGARDEIVRAVNRYICEKSVNGGRPKPLDQETLSRYLDTSGLPDPDLLIRTSGEQRVSNFLLWQIAYTEIYVTDVLWPDFSRKDFYRALLEYQKRERRFGLVSEQLPKGTIADLNY